MKKEHYMQDAFNPDIIKVNEFPWPLQTWLLLLTLILVFSQQTSEELKSENQETVSAASNGQKCEDNSTEERRKDDAKRESPDPSESSAKKSKTEDDDDVEMIEDDEDNVSDGIKKGLGVKMRRKSQEDDVQMIDFDEKSKAVEKSFAEAQRAILMKAASKCQWLFHDDISVTVSWRYLFWHSWDHFVMFFGGQDCFNGWL